VDGATVRIDSLVATAAIEDWFDAGECTELLGHRIFTRVAGDDAAPWLTLLHGFPTCSWDWSPIADELIGAGHRLLMLDFLGFGDSDKPRGHTYSIHEQADLVEALWEKHGVTETALVVHDYGVSVGQELLARHAEGRLAAGVTRIAFLNGGLYPDVHRPLTIQKLLRKPVLGPLISRMMNERRFADGFKQVFSHDHMPSDAEFHEHWLGVARHDGQRVYHRVIRYIDDRLRHERRWVGALEGTDVPRRFVWGMLDPVSGAHMAERLRERVGADEVHALDDVSHYPQLEAPERSASALTEFLASSRA
jgi:pimeloyl-ACP methyl ester carboxylesterase